METKLSDRMLSQLDAYWRASNYLSVGQIYLLDNPLLKEPLKRAHVKPRLVGLGVVKKAELALIRQARNGVSNGAGF